MIPGTGEDGEREGGKRGRMREGRREMWMKQREIHREGGGMNIGKDGDMVRRREQ